MEDDEVIDYDANPAYFHSRSHSFCSNLLYASSSANNIGQSLTAIPPFQQQTLIGIEALDGGRGGTNGGGLFFNGGRSSLPNRLMLNNPNNGGNNGGCGINFGHRISRQQEPQRPHLSSSWLERTFQRRECIKFIPADTHSDRCHCGRPSSLHSQLALSRFTSSVVIHGDLSSAAGHISGQWSIGTCTAGSPTDAYGTIEFQGGTHVHKARYVRLSFDSDPLDVVTLMERVWGFERPRLVISVHGGTADFNIPEKLGRMFREGLLKAAETTGAWVFTLGLDSGVVKHVARALDEAGISARMRSRIVTVGIAPWGLLRRSEQLIGCDSRICYYRQAGPKGDDGEYGECGRLFLNDRHSYFLLVDNGTVDRYGAEIVLRRRLEEFLARKTGNGNGNRIPIICVALEGGLCTLNGIHQFLNAQPPIPVIICEGSGRISDLLAMAEQHLDSDGKLPTNIRSTILKRISHQLSCTSRFIGAVAPIIPETILNQIVECARHGKKLLTVYRCNRDNKMMDHVILHTLLHGHKLARVDQLLMALAWGREDIARSEIFRQSAGEGSHSADPDWLFQPMMEALLMGNVDFVRLILEQGLSPKCFLTFERLEQLYNNSGGQTLMLIKKGRTPNLSRISHQTSTYFTLPQIGEAIERLMGNAFRSGYTTRAFKVRYERAKSKWTNADGQLKGGGGGTLGRQFSSLNMCLGGGSNVEEERQDEELRQEQRKCALSYSSSLLNGRSKDKQQHNSLSIPYFAFPFNELMLWAVLTRRHQMANLFWEYGEEPMAKALAAIRLYKCMSKEAAHDYTEVELSNQLREYAQEFRECSLELLNHCHQQDQRITMRLLTAELTNWGGHTCLSLAVIANNKRFLAHPCCQILLAELWHGGLRFRSQSNVKVVLGLVFPPSILLLDFKTLNTLEREEGIDSMKANQKFEDNNLLLERENLLLEKKEAEDVNLIKKKNGRQQQKFTFISNALSNFVLFYSAPITSFWIWSISFFLFMLALIYVLLIEFPREVSWLEWFIFVYVFSMALEHFRKLFVIESSSLFEKHRIFYNKYWNILTTIGILTYFVGFAFRLHPDKMHSYGRVILATNSVLWHMKMFDFLSVHPQIGPYITMAGKMVLAMSYIIVLLMVTLMAFGVARQSITFPHEKWAWILVRNIFYKPYFMLYGEVYAGEIDTCGDEGTNCVPGHWIPPILMTIFLLIANILLINMLIAIFNNIFNVTNAMSQQIWLFQRYGQVLEYKSTPVLPPPFTPIAHILMIIRYFCKSHSVCPHHHHEYGDEYLKSKSNGLNNDGDFALKVQLGAEELGELQDFEEDCMDDLCRRKCRQNMANTLATIKQQNHCDGDGGQEEWLALQIRQIQLKIDQFGAIQQRLIAHLMANSPTNKQYSANDEGKKGLGNNRLPNMKFIPRARIRPISCSAPTNNSAGFPQSQNANNSQQQRLRSSPNIHVPSAEFPISSAAANFTLFEEEMAENCSMLLEEEEENDQQQIWGEEIALESSAVEEEVTRRMPRNYSISLGEDLEQMFGMLRK